MMNSKAKKILFTFSVIASSLPFSGCKENEPTPVEPLKADSLKNCLIALNTTDNYTMTCTGYRIAEHTRIYLKDSISLLYKDNKSYDKIYYQDGDKGVYSIVYNGENYVGSTYYANMPKEVWSNKYFSTMKGVETDYVNKIDANATSLNITNKSYRTAFLKTVGYSAIDYVDLDDLVAYFDDNHLLIKMHFKNYNFNFTFTDFGTSTNSVLDAFLSGGGKPHELTGDDNEMISLMKSNNYEQQIYQFGETAQTTGYVGKNYFNPNYFFTNYYSSLVATGHVALDGTHSTSEAYKDIYGCYSFVLDYNKEEIEDILTLYPMVYYDEPDIPTYYNYPSKMMIWDHMEYLLNWNYGVFPVGTYKVIGNGYCITDPTMVYDIQNNFGILSSFDGAYPVAVGIDYFTRRTSEGTEISIIFVCKFSIGSYDYYMPFPFTNFGNTSNSLLDGIIELMKQ